MKPPTFVYLISDSNAVKIGISKDPKRRLSGIQTGNPNTCRILGFFPGGRDLEARLHKAFASKRAREHGKGEWFHLTEQDVQSVLALGDQLAKQATQKRQEERIPGWDPLATVIPARFGSEGPPALRFREETYFALLVDGDEVMPLGESVEIVCKGVNVTRDRMITELGIQRTLWALSRAESVGEENEILLQAAMLDAIRSSRSPGELPRILAYLTERQGERNVARDPDLLDTGTLRQIGALQTGTRMRRFLPLVSVGHVMLEMIQGSFTVSVGVAAVQAAKKQLAPLTLVVPETYRV